MPDRRPPIPRPLERSVLVEAGHRCSIPTCRQPAGLQLHHITPWAKVRRHTFDNLIVLCANCHSRVTSGEIDRQSVLAYKRNLGTLRSRYSEQEMRFLEMTISATDDVAAMAAADGWTDWDENAYAHVPFPASRRFDFWYLLRDGMVVETVHKLNSGTMEQMWHATPAPPEPVAYLYPFTARGLALLRRFKDGELI